MKPMMKVKIESLTNIKHLQGGRNNSQISKPVSVYVPSLFIFKSAYLPLPPYLSLLLSLSLSLSPPPPFLSPSTRLSISLSLSFTFSLSLFFFICLSLTHTHTLSRSLTLSPKFYYQSLCFYLSVSLLMTTHLIGSCSLQSAAARRAGGTRKVASTETLRRGIETCTLRSNIRGTGTRANQDIMRG